MKNNFNNNYFYLGESQIINITLTITTETALKKIDEIIILKVKNGKDMFLSVKSEIVPNIFGIPIEVLCHINKPISCYPWDVILELSNKKEKELSDNTKKLMENEEFSSVPKYLYTVIDFLIKYGKDEVYTYFFIFYFLFFIFFILRIINVIYNSILLLYKNIFICCTKSYL